MLDLKYHSRRDSVGLLNGDDADVPVCAITKVFPDMFPEYEIPNRVLDVGTGRGHFVSACVRKGLDAIGVDVRPEVYEGDRSRFVLADARNLPFQDGSFDMVHNSMIIGDIWGLQELSLTDVEEVIREYYRVIRRGGYLFISRDPALSEEDILDAGFRELRNRVLYQK
jgi:ubiquinone/menaquinone biosynthesis C-methylase UbiE